MSEAQVPNNTIRLKIISNGWFQNTLVVDAETGRELDGVIGVTWLVDRERGISRAIIELLGVPVEINETTETLPRTVETS